MSPSPKKSDAERKRQQRAKTRESEKLFNDLLDPMPDHIRESAVETGGNISKLEKTEAWERAPVYLVKHDKEDGPDATPYVDNDRHMAKPVSAASQARREEKTHRIYELRMEYPELWGERDKARIISARETAAGRPISVRTVQKYFAEYRALGRADAK